MATVFCHLVVLCPICKYSKRVLKINFSFYVDLLYSSQRYGMVLARYHALPNVKKTGCFGLKRLVAFTSEDSHYSMKKAVNWLGIGTDNLVAVKVDENGCMDVDDLIKNIEGVLEEGGQPFFVNATAGTTVLGAFDDLNAIADVCDKYKLWMHVDVSF